MRYAISRGILWLLLFPGVTFSQFKDAPAKDKPAEMPPNKFDPNKPAPKDEGPPDRVAEDQKLLRGLGLGVDGPALLDYFRKRTFHEADPKEMKVLLKQLGDEEFVIREKAYERLLMLGAGALVGIKEAEKDKDAEISRRAVVLRQHLETTANSKVQTATARLIAKTKPAGAAEVLLNFIPYAADQDVADEIGKTLGDVALVAGKVEPVLEKSLFDKIPIKRGAAGEAIARARVKELLPQVRKLLKDADPAVRLRVALALVPFKDKEVIPVLVDSLGLLTPEQLWPAEEILVKLAGDKVPSVSLGTNEATRKACRDAWQAWLDKEGKNIDLAKLEEGQAMLGYTLIAQYNIRAINVKIGGVRPNMGEVMELDAAKKPRWKIEVPTYPVDAQIVKVDGADRVLIAEYQGGKISERDFKGEVKWEKNVGGLPIGVQRLPGGTTFIVMHNRLLEIDREGNEVFNMNRPSSDIYRARKLRNGDIIFITNSGLLTRMESKTQKVLKTFTTAPMGSIFGGFDVLPNGGVLVPDFQRNRVVEYSADGQEVKTIAMQWPPNSAMRLPNGHTLVSSLNARRVAEFDGNGQMIWSHDLEGQPVIAKRR